MTSGFVWHAHALGETLTVHYLDIQRDKIREYTQVYVECDTAKSPPCEVLDGNGADARDSSVVGRYRTLNEAKAAAVAWYSQVAV